MFTQAEARALVADAQAAWCESRNDFRSFRIDRMEVVIVLDERFAHEEGRTLADFLCGVKRC